MIMLPTGATLEQTKQVVFDVQRHFQENEKEAVESCMTVSGVGFSGRAQTNGLVFIKLKDWHLRNRSDLRAKAIAERATKAFSKIRSALVFAFPPPSVIELGTATGFDFQLLDRGGLGHEKLMAARNQLLGMAAKDARLTKVRPNGLEDVPEYRVDVDWERAGALGVPITSIHNTISAAFGSSLCQQLHPGGAGQAGVPAGGRPLPDAAQGHREALRPEYHGQDGPLLRLCLRPLVGRCARGSSASTASRP